MTNTCVPFVVMLCLALTLCGCMVANENHEGGQYSASPRAVLTDQILRVGDRVLITVFGEEGLTGTYEVTTSGALQLPLVGSVPAGGRTTPELEQAVTAALRRRYLRDPKVTVAVVSQRPFYVLGEVEKPGEYAYRDGLNLWRALAMAGGETYRASRTTVFIQHAGEAGLAEMKTAEEIAIQPGDLIRVPERWF